MLFSDFFNRFDSANLQIILQRTPFTRSLIVWKEMRSGLGGISLADLGGRSGQRPLRGQVRHSSGSRQPIRCLHQALLDRLLSELASGRRSWQRGRSHEDGRLNFDKRYWDGTVVSIMPRSGAL